MQLSSDHAMTGRSSSDQVRLGDYGQTRQVRVLHCLLHCVIPETTTLLVFAVPGMWCKQEWYGRMHAGLQASQASEEAKSHVAQLPSSGGRKSVALTHPGPASYNLSGTCHLLHSADNSDRPQIQVSTMKVVITADALTFISCCQYQRWLIQCSGARSSMCKKIGPNQHCARQMIIS